MDADLEERQRIVDEEYRAESLRVVKQGSAFSARLADLLDEQDAILDEQFRRDDRRALVGVVVVFILVILTAAFCLTMKAIGGKL